MTKILFIGNSFTQRNDLPGLLEGLCAAARPRRPLETRRVIANGMALNTHWSRGEARGEIERTAWDYVVLQEQSTRPLKNRSLMHESVRRFDEEIVRRGARTVLYLTWARRENFDRQDELTDAYATVGRELGALVVPAGVAWQKALARDPSLVLHDRDGSHPNPAGSYLAACVFYATLFGQKPAGAGVGVSGVPDATVRGNLEAVAWRTVEEFGAAAGRQDG